MRESVLIDGTLHGVQGESACVIRAVKVSIPKLGISEYVKAEIAAAATELPEGRYELTFEGRKMKADKIAGDWRIVGF